MTTATKPCKDAHKHTEMPTGYSGYFGAAEMLHKKGYRQKRRCVCGLWEIWQDSQGKILKSYKNVPGLEHVGECGCLNCQGYFG